MSKDYREIAQDISAYTAEMRKLTPDAMQGFHALSKAASTGGSVDRKTKELVALAIGVIQRCDGCIAFHAKALKDLGATRKEIAEIMAMCVYMGGGPALMYAADALRAYDQFSEAA
ncbi:carboxymuconolactone decarboxylase family protein [Rhizobium leguminosarum]|jgi:AhpD family alkylhydroperoxidase|uniref:Carboxymuconolactone decarboxylase family protein n=1 Tax=Rhizobium leguminosarum TaxID=384 RepID=A0A4V2IIA5_RHILE|nr:carboxymuconolactone decarboxylase family protein [Rhizobium leguminosarum]TAU73104.1 carboxymuconolactone decarboxylase family protein [Rhizobium leguminosarum]TAU79273.1 carboxymuconolactone decarboxylase family protein [Rhizobium leguminosarum]TAV40766.1 carboxymuconolactone decarboxylase family protein [Rhizobium leguminosarum]TAV41726.1 carboxymuconolactone decarboxylase family protein [Rhizobium leguminosarum]TAV42193.1 carboxymuconolactone decarboxylase family protein [Rhizobium legu